MQNITVKCPACEVQSDLPTTALNGFDDIVRAAKSDAYDEGFGDGKYEGSSGDDTDFSHELGAGDQPMRRLACMIRARRWEDAEYWLDRVADAVGGRDLVDMGRTGDQHSLFATAA